VTKLTEEFPYPNSIEEGTVEYVQFRGKEVEIGVRVQGILLKGNRRLEDEPVNRREVVNLCIYRAYTFNGDNEVKIVGNANIEAKEPVVL
jgi:sulfate transport system ATP-binding protein